MNSHCPRAGCPHPLIRGFGCVAHGEPSVVLAPEVEAELTGERGKRTAAPRWTPEQWAFVLSRASEDSASAIAAALTKTFGVKRSFKSVKHQFERHHFAKPPVRSGRRAPTKKPVVEMRPGGRWTGTEKAALDDGELTVLVRVRSRDAIEAQARRMGTTARSGDGMQSVRQVSREHRIHHAVLLHWINRGLLPAERNGDLWRIDPAMADAIVPLLSRVSHRMAGRRGWWEDPRLHAVIDRKKKQVRALERNVDDLLRSGLVRSEE